jgi:phage N-6-adenine-methyltransferase
MAVNSGMFSSNRGDWGTPLEFFAKLDAEFRFTLDVCALPENAKCKKYFTPEDDGLKQLWKGVCWMNPPYGREIPKWMAKAYSEHLERHLTIVCLVPARTDTRWWHDFAMKGEIRLVKGRLKFGRLKSGAPFPSAIVIFRFRWWENMKG